MAAIALINKLLGGLFGSDTTVRTEEIAKLMGTIGEFAGANGDFADFDPTTFEKRFAEFDFANQQEGLQGFTTLMKGLEADKSLPLNGAGVRRALDAATQLGQRQESVIACARKLRERAGTKLASGLDLPEVHRAVADELETCSVPPEWAGKRGVYFQQLDLLKNDDIVNCSFAVAMQQGNVSDEKLAAANLPTLAGCKVLQHLLAP